MTHQNKSKTFLEKYLEAEEWNQSHGKTICANKHDPSYGQYSTVQFRRTMCPFSDQITVEITIENEDGESKITVSYSDFEDIAKKIKEHSQTNQK